MDWDDPGWREKSDNPWQRGLRLQQGWWRVTRAALPAGPVSRTNERLVVSMLPLEADFAPNLMTSEAVDAAQRALASLSEATRPGLIQEDRLKRNLLSSQPLCFNLFGHLSAHPEALLPWVRTIAHSATAITKVELEWAPSTRTLGGSAFDAFVEYGNRDGRGFIGVECKYAEDLKKSLVKPAAEKYRGATTTPVWLPDAITALDVTGLRQFWFNQLLTEALASSSQYSEGYGVVVACRADTKAADAAEAVSRQLKAPERLRFSSIEDIVASVEGHEDWKLRFGERYLDFGPIAHLLPPHDPRRAAAEHP